MTRKTDDRPGATPALDDDALRKLIETTIGSLGTSDPETLPHLVRERLKGQLAGDRRIEDIVRDLQKKR
jgi:hypothetical protein